jgi:hypothetical protein
MPPKGIVLPLNDRPARLTAEGESRLPNGELSISFFEHLFPIGGSRQGACDGALDA